MPEMTDESRSTKGEATVTDATRPSIGKGFRLQWESAQSAHVLLFPEGMIKLNASAGEILKRCNGTSSVAEIVADLERTFSAQGLKADVVAFITMAREKRWVALS
jgi:pyrroloquinoline quinone biosynthesis protein D